MISFFKKFLKILEPGDKSKLLILFIMMVFEAFFEILSIGMIAVFISAVDNPEVLLNIQQLKPLYKFLNINSAKEILIYGSILLILLFVFKNFYVVISRYVKDKFVYKRFRIISFKLFSLYMLAPYTFHLNRNSSDLIRNVATESYLLAEKIMVPILNIATEIVMLITIATFLIIVEPVISIVGLIFIGFVNIFFLKTTKNRLMIYGKLAQNERSKIIKIINEGLGGFKDVTIMNRQSWFLNRFQLISNKLSRAEIFKHVSSRSFRPILETIAVSSMLLVVLFLLSQGHSVTSLISILAIFALSINRLLPAINTLISEYSELRYYSSSIEPVYNDFNYLSQKPQVNLNRKSIVKNKLVFSKNIEVCNLSYAYPDNKPEVLENVSLTIKKGTAVGFVGSTGSGKTTLADLILGLLEPKLGKILVDGVDIHKNLKGWQKNLGYVPQFIYLTDDTIRHNITLGLEDSEIDEKQLKKVVEISQVKEFVEKLPLQLDTVIGERGVRLSGGQRQRIGIARALYHNPEVLIMDEATSSLDNITEKEVINAIDTLKERLTLIIIAHRLTTVKNCDLLFMIKDGMIVDTGTYSELFKRNKEFQQMAKTTKYHEK